MSSSSYMHGLNNLHGTEADVAEILIDETIEVSKKAFYKIVKFCEGKQIEWIWKNSSPWFPSKEDFRRLKCKLEKMRGITIGYY